MLAMALMNLTPFGFCDFVFELHSWICDTADLLIYFKNGLILPALFNYDDQVCAGNEREMQTASVVTLDNMGIDEHTFRGILDFIYTAEVEFNPDNIQDMLQAADQLLMTDLKSLCCEYLDTCVTTQNCIGMFDFTSLLSCSWSHLKVSQYLDENFSEVSAHEEFLQLDVARVETFLSRKTIMVRTEDEVLDIVIRWYLYDSKNRLQQALRLLRNVLFAKQVTHEALERLSDIVDDENSCEFHRELLYLQAQQDGLPQIQRGYTRLLVACGGEGSSSVEKDDTEIKDYVRCLRIDDTPVATSSNSWLDLASMHTPRSGHGVVEVAGCLYAAGGRDKNCRILNSCEKYDPVTNRWTNVAVMNHARVGFGLVAIEKWIYALGGSNDMTDPLMSVEMYNIFTNQWSPLPDMIVKKAWACYAAVGKKIYVLGGGIIAKFYESVEVFDTQTHTWYAVSPMTERRCDARAVAVDNNVYVFGGFRRIECPSAAHSGHSLKLCGTEFYSERIDTWRPLHSRSSEPGLCEVGEKSVVCSALCDGDRIFVVGELHMNGECHTVRAYNIQTCKWECLVASSPKMQTHFPCCLLSIPTYIFNKLLLAHGNAET